MNNALHSLSVLVFKYLKGELNEAEAKELNDYLDQSESNRIFFNQLTSPDHLNECLEKLYAVDDKAMWRNIVAATPSLQKAKILSIRTSLKYAAAVILIAGLGAYWLMGRHHKTEVAKARTESKPVQNDILPGGNKATLTLANGEKIILDNATNGSLAKEGETEIVKTGDGQLAYNAQRKGTDVYYNTVSTPRGGQYQLILSDGTRVWMNAASELRFPTAFTGKERLVELEGEAYFEVAKNVQMPFIVQSKNGMTVQVLGTHFNVNSYNDEASIKTTLLEGSVKISNGDRIKILKPGQQAQVANGADDKNIRVVSDVNTEEVIAWKNGLFNFNGADIPSALRQLARWYDIEIVYEGEIPRDKFRGKVQRKFNLSQALEILEHAGLKFKVEGRKLIVKQQ